MNGISHIFREYDIRGVFEKDLSEDEDYQGKSQESEGGSGNLKHRASEGRRCSLFLPAKANFQTLDAEVFPGMLGYAFPTKNIPAFRTTSCRFPVRMEQTVT